ncbi:hypothetical protein [Micromonospora sp. HM5-17]|uniref:hypothetical protein n=1 Tax=Micromonospora sp. HM5-17 TaxID=2487710 RepID=UPI0011CD8188|nr:hypothetical protein [Micromonospora sp. HM5-17]
MDRYQERYLAHQARKREVLRQLLSTTVNTFSVHAVGALIRGQFPDRCRYETPVEATMSAWRFACDRYPSLVVPAPPGAARDVRFRGGVALVRDQRAADHLIQHGGPLGITLIDGPLAERVTSEDVPGGGDVPDGAIRDVMAWVDGDRARAARALEVELARGDRARTTLVRALEAMTRDA